MKPKVIAPVELTLLILSLVTAIVFGIWQHYSCGAVDFKPFAVGLGGILLVILIVLYRIVSYLIGFLVEVSPMMAIIRDWLQRMAK